MALRKHPTTPKTKQNKKRALPTKKKTTPFFGVHKFETTSVQEPVLLLSFNGVPGSYQVQQAVS